jgi:hypothetical protein
MDLQIPNARMVKKGRTPSKDGHRTKQHHLDKEKW